MQFDIKSFIYEGFYSLRIVLGIILYTNLYLNKKRRIKLPYIILLFTLVIVVGMCFNLLLILLFNIQATQTFTRILNIIWYCSYFFVIFGISRICYKQTYSNSSFVFSLACLSESVIFGASSHLVDIGVHKLQQHTVTSLILELVITLLFYTGFYFISKFFLKKEKLSDVSNTKLFSFFVLFVIEFNMFLRLGLQHIYYQEITNGWIINVVLTIIPTLFWLLQNFIFVTLKQRNEQEKLDLILLEREKQYKIRYQNIEEVNKTAHDLKRKLRAIELVNSKESEVAIKEINNSLSKYDANIETDNALINTILNEKSEYCINHNIKFSTIPDVSCLFFISPIDIYTLLDNLLSNAIEAVEKITDKEKRCITFTISKEKNIVCILTKNYFNGELLIEDNTIKTTKTDGGIHGYGVKSIKALTEKYNGTMTINHDNNIFTTIILIPIPTK